MYISSSTGITTYISIARSGLAIDAVCPFFFHAMAQCNDRYFYNTIKANLVKVSDLPGKGSENIPRNQTRILLLLSSFNQPHLRTQSACTLTTGKSGRSFARTRRLEDPFNGACYNQITSVKSRFLGRTSDATPS